MIGKCYDEALTTLNKSITPSFWVNLLFWPGFIVDAISAKMWKYDSNLLVLVNEKKDCKNES